MRAHTPGHHGMERAHVHCILAPLLAVLMSCMGKSRHSWWLAWGGRGCASSYRQHTTHTCTHTPGHHGMERERMCTAYWRRYWPVSCLAWENTAFVVAGLGWEGVCIIISATHTTHMHTHTGPPPPP